MIIMALDHTRDFFGMPGANPTNIETTTPALFFTRWITHFCAPTFFLLTGTGAFLSLGKQSVRALSRFLLTRGIWLIVLELTVLRFALQFNVDYRLTIVNVLWALGWSMIVLSALVHLPTRTVIALGAVLIAGHNLLDGVQSVNPVWTILHSPNVLLNAGGRIVFIAYPLLPWIGVTAVGYGLGTLYSWSAERRRRALLRLGLGMTTAFGALRALNIYGDPSRWTARRSTLFAALSFLNTTKYPPSLLFLLMTLGPVLLALRAMDGGTPRVLRPAAVIGKVPLMYFLVHMALIHLIAVGVTLARFGAMHWMFESPSFDRYPITPPPGWGYSPRGVYLVWLVVVIAMYPLCRWFAAVKQRRRDAWLSYL